MTVKRGEIYWIDDRPGIGSEQWGDRPSVIVSNDIGNRYSPTVEIVYITQKRKKPLPTHVTIRDGQVSGTILCEAICTVDKRRLGDKVGRVNKEKMEQIDNALRVSLGIR